MRLLIAVLVAACGDNQPPPDAMPAFTQVALVPETPNRDLDMLFVIDDSTNFLATQRAFAAGFQALADELSTMCEAPGDCYQLILDRSCTASALRLSVHRASPAAPGSMFSVRCTTP